MKRILITTLLVLSFAPCLSAQRKHSLPPSPIHSSVMASFMVKKDGRLNITGGWGYFFTHEKGVLKVLRNGELVDEFVLKYTVSRPVLQEYDIGELKSWQKNRYGLYLKEPGDYEFEFYMGGNKFYSFPFKLNITGGSDPYNPQKVYRLEGDWNDHAFLYRNNKHTAWDFMAWYRSPTDSQEYTKYKFEMTRDSDGKVVAGATGGFQKQRFWKRQDFRLTKRTTKTPSGSWNTQELKLGGDKFEDGGHTIKTHLDGKLYATYKFNVKDGEIELQGRQVREKTNPIRFIEGGRNQFWMKKVD